MSTYMYQNHQLIKNHKNKTHLKFKKLRRSQQLTNYKF